jgi:hypothetical protein
MDEKFYQPHLQRLTGAQRSIKLTNQIKRKLLIKNLNHDIISWDQLVDQMSVRPYLVEIDQLLEKNIHAYNRLCEYLNITPLAQEQFTNIIDRYNSKQWKRF